MHQSQDDGESNEGHVVIDTSTREKNVKRQRTHMKPPPKVGEEASVRVPRRTYDPPKKLFHDHEDEETTGTEEKNRRVKDKSPPAGLLKKSFDS